MNVVSPVTLDHALEALAASTEAKILAGGTDLMVEFETGRTQAHSIIDVWRVDELRGIAPDGHGLRIGALTSCNTMYRDERVPDVLAAAAFEVGAEQIRNRATIGGNLGTASPAADLTPVLFALDAIVRLRSLSGHRDVPVAEFIVGYRTTTRRPDELIESVWVPDRAPGERRGFRKVGTRRAQSISKVVVAIAVELDGSRVVRVASGAGSVAASTITLPSLHDELAGHSIDTDRAARAARRAASHDAAPIDDVRSTERYRREVLFRVLRTLILSCADGCGSGETSA